MLRLQRAQLLRVVRVRRVESDHGGTVRLGAVRQVGHRVVKLFLACRRRSLRRWLGGRHAALRGHRGSHTLTYVRRRWLIGAGCAGCGACRRTHRRDFLSLWRRQREQRRIKLHRRVLRVVVGIRSGHYPPIEKLLPLLPLLNPGLSALIAAIVFWNQPDLPASVSALISPVCIPIAFSIAFVSVPYSPASPSAPA